MSTLRYRVIAPGGITVGDDSHAINEIVNLTAGGAKYFLLNHQIQLASEQAPVGVPDGPSEDDVYVDILIDSKIKTVSLTTLREMFPNIKGNPGDIGPQGLKGNKGDQGDQGEKGDIGQGLHAEGAVSSAICLPPEADEGDLYFTEDNGHGWVRTSGIYVDIGPMRGPQGIQGPQGLKGDQGDQGDQGIQGPQGLKGDLGDQGIQGPQGSQGGKGDQGDQGLQGIQGIQGVGGVKGDTGDVGDPTAYAGTVSPVMDGAAEVGASLNYARENHVHPTDTTRAPLDSPGLTGTPTAPTPTAGDNTNKIATMAAIQAAIANLISSAPLALDTLTELAAALGNDPNFATTITNALALKAPLASPALTGAPTAPTAAAATNTNQLATTAFVEAVRVILAAADALKAPLASPALTGTPTAPTAAIGTATTQIATLAAVRANALHGPSTVSVSLDTIVAAGAYFAESSCTNGPVATTQYYLIVQKYPGGPNYVQQTAWDLTASGGMWTRNQAAGSWSAWVRVADRGYVDTTFAPKASPALTGAATATTANTTAAIQGLSSLVETSNANFGFGTVQGNPNSGAYSSTSGFRVTVRAGIAGNGTFSQNANTAYQNVGIYGWVPTGGHGNFATAGMFDRPDGAGRTGSTPWAVYLAGGNSVINNTRALSIFDFTTGTEPFYVTPNGAVTCATANAPLLTLTDGASIAWAGSSSKARVTLAGNRTMAALTGVVEGTTYFLWVGQDATGSRTLAYTTTGAGSFDFGTAGAPTLTTTASRFDLLCFEAVTLAGTLKLRFCGIQKGFV